MALVVKNLLANAGRPKRRGFDPWVGKIPWRRKWQPTLVFFPGESHGQRSLVGYSPWGCKESDTTEPFHCILWWPAVCFLCLWLYSCFVNKFICNIFYILHISDTIISFSLWLSSLSMITLGPSMLMQMTVFHCFVWLSSGPSYTCITSP